MAKVLQEREYQRWVGIDAHRPLDRARAIAEREGMFIIYAGKPGMVAWYGFVLQGTSCQMLAVESGWTKTKLDWYRKQPQGAWPI